jgi:hypothetical protein
MKSGAINMENQDTERKGLTLGNTVAAGLGGKVVHSAFKMHKRIPELAENMAKRQTAGKIFGRRKAIKEAMGKTTKVFKGINYGVGGAAALLGAAGIRDMLKKKKAREDA